MKMVLINSLMVGSYVPFLDNANKFYHERFGFTVTHAGRIVTIGYIVAGTPPSKHSLQLVNHRQDLRQNARQAKAAHQLVHHHVYLVSLPVLPAQQGLRALPELLLGDGVWHAGEFRLATLGISYACYSAILMPALQSTVPESQLGKRLESN